MFRSACGQVDTRSPSLVERIRRSIDHAGKQLDPFKLSQGRGWQDGLDRRAQALIVDGPCKPARETNRHLLEGHDLQAVTAVACGVEAKLSHRQTAMGDDGPPVG